jgi:hypothetical protein
LTPTKGAAMATETKTATVYPNLLYDHADERRSL